MPGSLTASTEDEPNLFTLSLDSDGKSQTFSVDWAVGGTNYATISCTLSTDKGDDLALNIPSDSLDLSDDATKDAYFGDGTQTKDCLKRLRLHWAFGMRTILLIPFMMKSMAEMI